MKNSLKTLAPRCGAVLVSLFAASSVQANTVGVALQKPGKGSAVTPRIVMWGEGVIKPGTKRVTGREKGRTIGSRIVMWGEGVIKPGTKIVMWGEGVIKPRIVMWGEGVIKPGTKLVVWRQGGQLHARPKMVMWGQGSIPPPTVK